MVNEKKHGEKYELVGGWTNPFEKYARQTGNLPQFSGWKQPFMLSWRLNSCGFRKAESQRIPRYPRTMTEFKKWVSVGWIHWLAGCWVDQDGRKKWCFLVIHVPMTWMFKERYSEYHRILSHVETIWTGFTVAMPTVFHPTQMSLFQVLAEFPDMLECLLQDNTET